MKLDLNGMGIEVTDGIKEYAEKRVSKLDKFFDNDTIAHVTFAAKKEKQYDIFKNKFQFIYRFYCGHTVRISQTHKIF